MLDLERHPLAYPFLPLTSLMRRPILNHLRRGESVYDSFLGFMGRGGLRAGALTKRALMGGEAERFTLKGRSRAALGESAQRAHPPERGSFREYWPFREHVCRSAVNQKAEVFALRFVWLRKQDSNSEP